MSTDAGATDCTPQYEIQSVDRECILVLCRRNSSLDQPSTALNGCDFCRQQGGCSVNQQLAYCGWHLVPLPTAGRGHPMAALRGLPVLVTFMGSGSP